MTSNHSLDSNIIPFPHERTAEGRRERALRELEITSDMDPYRLLYPYPLVVDYGDVTFTINDHKPEGE